MYIRKIFRCTSVLVALTFGSLNSYAQSSRFEGLWRIINERSDFGGLAPKVAAPQSIKADIVGDSMFVVRTFDALVPAMESLKLGALPTEIALDKQTVKLSSVIWNRKFNGFVFKSTYEVDGAEVVYWRTETWRIKNGLLVVNRTTILPDKTDSVTAYYKKYIGI